DGASCLGVLTGGNDAPGPGPYGATPATCSPTSTPPSRSARPARPAGRAGARKNSCARRSPRPRAPGRRATSPPGGCWSGPTGRSPRGGEEVVRGGDRSAHAVRRAALARSARSLRGTALVTNLEPCVLCTGAAVQAGVDLMVYGLNAPADEGSRRVAP